MKPSECHISNTQKPPPSPFSASPVITILDCGIAAHTLVFSIDDSTEAVIQRKIGAMQRFIREDPEQAIQISSVAKKHFQLQIETLQNAPRDPEKLEQIIKAKEREKDKARHIDDTQRLVTEIEMLKLVLFVVLHQCDSRIEAYQRTHEHLTWQLKNK